LQQDNFVLEIPNMHGNIIEPEGYPELQQDNSVFETGGERDDQK